MGLKLITTSIFITILLSAHSQCNESSLVIQQIRAKDTDSNIDWEINKHYTYYNPTCVNRGILVVHLVGSYDNPSNNLMFPTFAANNGFHVVSLKYENGTAAQTACNNSTDINCYENFRKEVIEGGDYHPDITVDVANSVNNRLIKLLTYLETNNPNENWGNYYSGTTINWDKIIISGHSQGGGHAALIAKKNKVKRCLMFASPNDYSTNFNAPAIWTSLNSITPDSLYFGLNNLFDDVVAFYKQFEAWNNLGMPAFGDSLNVDLTTNYFPSHQLYTTTTGPNANQNHSIMIRDDQTILDGNGKSIYEPVWEYMLGITIGLSIDENSSTQSNFNVFPNPATNQITIDFSYDSNLYYAVIYNLQGQIVLKEQISQSNSMISLNQVPAGLYFLNIENTKGEVVYSNKLTKID